MQHFGNTVDCKTCTRKDMQQKFDADDVVDEVGHGQGPQGQRQQQLVLAVQHDTPGRDLVGKSEPCQGQDCLSCQVLNLFI